MPFPSSNLASSAPVSLPEAIAPADPRAALIRALTDCRRATVALVSPLDPTVLTQQAHPDFSPVGWHLGHLAFTESLWVLAHLAQQPDPFPQYQDLFAADGLPKHQRQRLPDWDTLQDYMAAVRDRVLAYLHRLSDATLLTQLRLWYWLLQHHSQHAETITLVLALHQRQGQVTPLLPLPVATAPTRPSQMVRVPAGEFWFGSNEVGAIDNERPGRWVHLPDYWLDDTPVTCGQYQDFMAAGGYCNRQWWSAQGWDWLQTSRVSRPLYWCDGIDPNTPVSGVCAHEAEAYARYVGKRLPTEAEWEKAASWNPATGQSQPYPWGSSLPAPTDCNYGHHIGHTTPVATYPASPVGCYDLLGNVWEWTSSPFEGYPGFAAYPYAGYSQTYFDGQHRVLRGGSWATYPWALRNRFRNWYHPFVRELFMGFRCARDA